MEATSCKYINESPPRVLFLPSHLLRVMSQQKESNERNTVDLSGTNWQFWSIQIACVLTLDGLAKWIEGEVSPRETQQEAYDNFMALAEEMTEAEAQKEPQQGDTDRSTAKKLAKLRLITTRR